MTWVCLVCDFVMRTPEDVTNHIVHHLEHVSEVGYGKATERID